MGDSETKAVLCPPGLLVSRNSVPSIWQKQWFAGRRVNTAGETGIPLILKKKIKKYKHLILCLRKKVTVGVDREQTVCPSTSAALKEKKTRSWKSTQPLSDMANDNYSSCFKVGHLGSCSLPPSRELLLWSFGGLSQLLGQHEDVRLTGPQDLSIGTVNEGASSAAALPTHAWGSYSPALIWRPKAIVLTHPWQVLSWCLLLEETLGKTEVELVLKKLKII